MNPPPDISTPLRQALLNLIPLERRQETLRLMHALTQTVMVNCAVETGRTDAELAADARCYGRSLREIEELLGEKPNPFVTPNSKTAKHVALSPEEFDQMKARMEKARNGQPTN